MNQPESIKSEVMRRLEERLRLLAIAKGMPAELDAQAAAEWMHKADPGYRRLDVFYEMMAAETERGCVIVAAALIDDALQSAIRAFLKLLPGVTDKGLDSVLSEGYEPPLRPYSSRADFALALGLIDATTRKALSRIGRMRNSAAHLAEPFAIEPWMKELAKIYPALSKKEQALLSMLTAASSQSPEWEDQARWIFQVTAQSIYFRLLLVAEQPEKAAEICAGVSSTSGLYDAAFDEIMACVHRRSRSSDDASSAAQT